MTNSLSKRTGRPKDVEKRQAILDAARMLFFAHGVEGVSVERIAAEAGVSKGTVYGHFGDKLAIFEAIVGQVTDLFQSGLDAVALGDLPIDKALISFGEQLLNQLVERDLIGFDEVLALEAPKQPDLARRFFRAGPGRTRDALAQGLSARAKRGELLLDDPHEAADHFVGLCQGMLMTEIRFHERRPPSRVEVRKRVAAAVAVFLRAYGSPQTT